MKSSQNKTSELNAREQDLALQLQELRQAWAQWGERYRTIKQELAQILQTHYGSSFDFLEESRKQLQTRYEKSSLLNQKFRQDGTIKDIENIRTSTRQQKITTTKSFVDIVMNKFADPKDYFLAFKDDKRFYPDPYNPDDIQLQRDLLDAIPFQNLDNFSDSELQSVFSALTSHQRSKYSNSYPKIAAQNRYRADASSYLDELFDRLKQAQAHIMKNWAVSWKFVRIPLVQNSHVILASYNQQEFIEMYHKTNDLRREIYETHENTQNSVAVIIDKLDSRTRQLESLLTHYQAKLQEHESTTSLKFWKDFMENVVIELQQYWPKLANIQQATSRFNRLETLKTVSYINYLWSLHGVLQDVNNEIIRSDMMIASLTKYL